MKLATPEDNTGPVQLLVLDVDGVQADDGLWLDQEGRLQKRFEVQDGLVLRFRNRHGLNWLLSVMELVMARKCGQDS